MSTATLAPPAARATRPAPPRRRLAACLLPALAVIALSAVPAVQVTGWQWASLALAVPVAVWGAWPVHRAAWRGLARGTATADLPASLGIAVALAWSAGGLVLGAAGTLGARQPFSPGALAAAGPATVYLGAAAGIAVAALAGRCLRAPAPDPPAFAPCVLAVAVTALGFWLGAGLPAAAGCGAMIAVLAVACPAGLTAPDRGQPGDLAALREERAARAAAAASLRWAAGYNVIALPVAAAGALSPLLAPLAMTASCAVVAAGSRRVRRARGGAP